MGLPALTCHPDAEGGSDGACRSAAWSGVSSFGGYVQHSREQGVVLIVDVEVAGIELERLEPFVEGPVLLLSAVHRCQAHHLEDCAALGRLLLLGGAQSSVRLAKEIIFGHSK